MNLYSMSLVFVVPLERDVNEDVMSMSAEGHPAMQIRMPPSVGRMLGQNRPSLTGVSMQYVVAGVSPLSALAEVYSEIQKTDPAAGEPSSVQIAKIGTTRYDAGIVGRIESIGPLG